MTLYKILKYLSIAVGALGVILFFWLMSKGGDALTNSAELQDSILNPFLSLTYFIFGLTILAVLVFLVVRLFSGNIKVTLISVGAFLVVFLISYATASDQTSTLPNGTQVSGSMSQWVETGLNMFYILGVVAVLALCYSSVKKLLIR